MVRPVLRMPLQSRMKNPHVRASVGYRRPRESLKWLFGLAAAHRGREWEQAQGLLDHRGRVGDLVEGVGLLAQLAGRQIPHPVRHAAWPRRLDVFPTDSCNLTQSKAEPMTGAEKVRGGKCNVQQMVEDVVDS